MRKFYSKEIPDSPVYVAGHPLTFDILETQDAALIVELDKCVNKGVGGVLSLSEEQFNEELKKKETGKLSANSLRPRQSRTELSAIQLAGLHVAVDGVRPSQFARPQQPDHRPHTRHGLPFGGGLNGKAPPPANAPDPIEVPTAQSFPEVFQKPPTAKMSEVMK